jgi:hypothetical protein
MMNSPIGGYFELELNERSEYHPDAIRLNTGRNAFEYALRGRGYRKVYLPFYTCEVMLRTVKKLNLEHQFYHIDENFEPIFDLSKITEGEVFVYTNYFGLKDRCVETLANACRNLIVDNAQAFFSKPISSVDIFYSPRKFFGLPDGAYLYTDAFLHEPLEQDHSDKRFEPLLRRVEYEPEDGFINHQLNNQILDTLPMMRMSKLTLRLLQNIDYQQVAMRRRKNFQALHNELRLINKLEFSLADDQVPMIYPFYFPKPGLRQQLIEERIFVAQYWPNVLQWTKEDDLEHEYAENLIALPIDQRYSHDDMNRIVTAIGRYYFEENWRS